MSKLLQYGNLHLGDADEIQLKTLNELKQVMAGN